MTRATTRALTLGAEQVERYHRDGFLIVEGLFAAEDVCTIREHFDGLAEGGEPIERNGGKWKPEGSELGPDDPLKRYPRVIHPHRLGELGRRYLLDRRVYAVLRDLLGEEPLACSSMFYFKPPGSRGQAFHQDNFYLRVKPGKCLAAWTAIDPSLPENGGLYVCPGTHRMDIACPEQADTGESFTTELVRPPADVEPIPAKLEPGDVLFFDGAVIHGSQPNTTTNLWRRSLICHYMPASSTHIWMGYLPALTFDGREVRREENEDGGPCGTPAKEGMA